MKLGQEELMQLYEAVVKPFEHPDPLGYMVRALLVSEGDPDFIDGDGDRGFMPVSPSRATQMTGVQEVQTLQNNVIATLTMDRMLYEQYQSIDDMIVAFHFGEEVVQEEYQGDEKAFLEAVTEAHEDVEDLLHPPLATVDDVISLLDQSDSCGKMSKSRKTFFKKLIKDGA